MSLCAQLGPLKNTQNWPFLDPFWPIFEVLFYPNSLLLWEDRFLIIFWSFFRQIFSIFLIIKNHFFYKNFWTIFWTLRRGFFSFRKFRKMDPLWRVPLASKSWVWKMAQKGGQPPVGFYSTNSLIQIAIFGHFWSIFGSILIDNFDLFSPTTNKSWVCPKIHFFDTKNQCFFHWNFTTFDRKSRFFYELTSNRCKSESRSRVFLYPNGCFLRHPGNCKDNNEQKDPKNTPIFDHHFYTKFWPSILHILDIIFT